MDKAHSQSSTDETGSLFSFASDLSAKGYNLTETISMSRSRSIYGPASGTFENMASEEDSVNDKVIDTYTTHRMDKKYINTVIQCISCSSPLFHENSGVSANTLKHACWVFLVCVIRRKKTRDKLHVVPVLLNEECHLMFYYLQQLAILFIVQSCSM